VLFFCFNCLYNCLLYFFEFKTNPNPMPEAFTEENLLIIIRLIVAHLVADFLLQPDSWIADRNKKKAKSYSLYLHGLVVGIVTYVFLADWRNPYLPLFIMVTHIIIDLWKSYKKDNAFYFSLDQFLHFIIILFGWLFYINALNEVPVIFNNLMSDFRIWTIFMAYCIIIWPTGYFIAKATLHWRLEIDEVDKSELIGLSYAGKWIGRIERVLILTFVIFNQYEAIGFLIAAKSIFRVNGIKDKNDRKEVEYILIGTLMSFTIAIVTGLIIRELLLTFSM